MVIAKIGSQSLVTGSSWVGTGGVAGIAEGGLPGISPVILMAGRKKVIPPPRNAERLVAVLILPFALRPRRATTLACMA